MTDHKKVGLLFFCNFFWLILLFFVIREYVAVMLFVDNTCFPFVSFLFLLFLEGSWTGVGGRGGGGGGDRLEFHMAGVPASLLGSALYFVFYCSPAGMR